MRNGADAGGDIRKRSIIRFSSSTSENKGDFVVNAPLTIMLNKRELATIVCSPYAKELVVGFLAERDS